MLHQTQKQVRQMQRVHSRHVVNRKQCGLTKDFDHLVKKIQNIEFILKFLMYSTNLQCKVSGYICKHGLYLQNNCFQDN